MPTYIYPMPKVFDTIFVPVDFSVNTDTALEKAASLCADQGCIHLFHVQRTDHSLKGVIAAKLFGLSTSELMETRMALKFQLGVLKDRIGVARPDISVYSWVDFGTPVERAIIRKSVYLGADLIIIGKNRPHSFGSLLSTVIPTRIASLSGVAVLTVKPGCLATPIKTVVLTIGHKYPAEKVALLSALHTTQRMKIRLVSFKKNRTGRKIPDSSLIQALRTLRHMTPFPVEYDVLKGQNAGKELLQYCQDVCANVLIVQPGVETQVNGWFRTYLADLLPADSATQILSVNPV